MNCAGALLLIICFACYLYSFIRQSKHGKFKLDSTGNYTFNSLEVDPNDDNTDVIFRMFMHELVLSKDVGLKYPECLTNNDFNILIMQKLKDKVNKHPIIWSKFYMI